MYLRGKPSDNWIKPINSEFFDGIEKEKGPKKRKTWSERAMVYFCSERIRIIEFNWK